MSLDLLLAQKITYGLTPALAEKVRKIGFQSYLENQLSPKESEDPIYFQKFQSTTYTIEQNKKLETRNFTCLKLSAQELFSKFNKPDVKEKNLPAFEVYADTWLRALHSEWQLKEMIVEFWHNHFNISILADERIAISLPLYDTTIRKNCFGNFRVLLEAIAKSPAMLYYLDNYNSRASPANENYARELFELHTLGAESYLNHLYNRWKEVPNALQEKPIGYIDEDVYEAARAFTGWTVADGSDNQKGGRFPNTGEFLYFEGWHDNYQKRVLGVEFPPNQPPMADGLKVLDLVASHPSTAKYICTKICRRFISDNPPESIIKKAVETWQSHIKSPEQIKQVLRTILTSEEFKESVGKKSKRPFELLVSALRSLQIDIQPNQMLVYLLAQTGHTPFMWATPTGHPDVASYWHNPNFLLTRWNSLIALISEDWHKITKPLNLQMPSNLKTPKEIAQYWLSKLLPIKYSESLLQKCANFIAGGGDIDEEPVFYDERDRNHKIMNMILLVAMSPEFQIR
jgi:uncharacterized protein (DUF1800 family)